MPRKTLIAVLAAACVALAGCNSDPSLRVHNQLAGKANVDLFTVPASTAATLTIHDVAGGATGSYLDFAPGRYRVHAALQGATSPADVQFDALQDQKYTVVIYGTDAAPVLRVDTD